MNISAVTTVFGVIYVRMYPLSVYCMVMWLAFVELAIFAVIFSFICVF